MKKAFITGISGQDGSYLAEYLLRLGYEVHGLIRPKSAKGKDNPLWRIQGFQDQLNLHKATVEDYASMGTIIKAIKPDECYHLAGQSFVLSSPEEKSSVLNINTHATHHILLAIHEHAPECRIFFAGSAEMFGQVDHEPQNEQTPFNPRVLYGVSKVMGHTLMKHYRNHHGLFTSTGIMYNHESPRRGIRFVTRKITLTAAKIKLGLERELRLGNIESQRDWGYAGDFIVAMHSALNAATPEDYVIATGKTRTIQDFLGVAFGELDLDYKKYLVVDPEFFRTKEKIPLVGDAQKAKANLNWQPRVSFEEMVRKMVQSDLDYMKKLGQG